ncbi:amidohydrolase family protein [Aliiglaciecola sp. LCG003]|uniref:amidohydrolase family protein n=1 Tax=Aliiglaciecola sp. LCG003 TaxID=3053655 RepID=UPI002572FFD8|nr:amidohydrolase family protein [Aliiglaciecola sp. LCG003]WJG10351.1 amidohydrolase family protein [Aliiglaciecola sp. LCG003]
MQHLDIIDPHIHLFDLEKGEYTWLKTQFWQDKANISQSFCDSSLIVKSPLSLVGYVHIEAGFNNPKPWLEIANIEQRRTLPVRTIGSLDLTLSSNDFKHSLKEQLQYDSCVGFRHIFNEQTIDILSHRNAKKNLADLNRLKCNFELQITVFSPTTIEKVIKVFAFYSDIKLVLNHAGFAPIQAENLTQASEYSLWQNAMRRLAEGTNAHVKCSGWEMTNANYTQNHLIQPLTFLKSVYGQSRVMFASNFPLCLLTMDYQTYWTTVIQVAQHVGLSPKVVCHDNAFKLYKFNTH